MKPYRVQVPPFLLLEVKVLPNSGLWNDRFSGTLRRSTTTNNPGSSNGLMFASMEFSLKRHSNQNYASSRVTRKNMELSLRRLDATLKDTPTLLERGVTGDTCKIEETSIGSISRLSTTTTTATATPTPTPTTTTTNTYYYLLLPTTTYYYPLLPTTHYPLPTTYYLLPTTTTTYYLLPTTYYLLLLLLLLLVLVVPCGFGVFHLATWIGRHLGDHLDG